MWNPFQRDPLQLRLNKARKEMLRIKSEQELSAIEEDLSDHRRRKVYESADPAHKQRLDAERQVMLEEARNRLQPVRQQARRDLISIDQEAIHLLTAARNSVSENQTSEQAVTVHAQESILEAVNGTPYAFDLISEYRQLLQAFTLIFREPGRISPPLSAYLADAGLRQILVPCGIRRSPCIQRNRQGQG